MSYTGEQYYIWLEGRKSAALEIGNAEDMKAAIEGIVGDYEWAVHARDDLIPKMKDSMFVITISPGDDPDPKIALETGYAVLLNKPIIAVIWPGRPGNEGLERVAQKVVRLEAPLDTDAGQQQLTAAIMDIKEMTRNA